MFAVSPSLYFVASGVTNCSKANIQNKWTYQLGHIKPKSTFDY